MRRQWWPDFFFLQQTCVLAVWLWQPPLPDDALRMVAMIEKADDLGSGSTDYYVIGPTAATVGGNLEQGLDDRRYKAIISDDGSWWRRLRAIRLNLPHLQRRPRTGGRRTAAAWWRSYLLYYRCAGPTPARVGLAGVMEWLLVAAED
jgi:hypothetical protein